MRDRTTGAGPHMRKHASHVRYAGPDGRAAAAGVHTVGGGLAAAAGRRFLDVRRLCAGAPLQGLGTGAQS